MKHDVTKTHFIEIDNISDFLSAVGKSFYHIFIGKIDEIPVDIMDIGSSLGLAATEEKLVWKLINTSVMYAAKEMVGNWTYDTIYDNKKIPGKYIKLVDKAKYKDKIIIDHKFFAKPKDSLITEYLQSLLTEQLVNFEIDPKTATNIVDRFPSYFVYALHKEWGKNAHIYSKLDAIINTPFTNAVTIEKEWNLYNLWLEKQINQNVFAEAFSLQQIYVPLSAYYFDNSVETADEIEQKIRKDFLQLQKKKKAVLVNLEKHFDCWLDNNDKDDAIKIISGGPGSGKSTFTKIYAAHASTFMQVIHIPLHLLDLSINLEDAINRFLKRSEHFSSNPISDLKNMLLIFDGLDEIAQQGRASLEIANDFVMQVEKLVSTVNIASMRLRVIISGREILLQSIIHRFRKSGQVLHMMPYCFVASNDTDYEHETYINVNINNNILIEEEINNLLEKHNNEGNLKKDEKQSIYKVCKGQKSAEYTIDRRREWWNKYAKITGNAVDEQLLSRNNLFEITNQPLLNYLLTLSIKDKKDATQINLNNLYENMVDKVYSNVHNASRNSFTDTVERDDFNAILEEIAVSIWQGNSRTSTYGEIKRRCEKRGLDQILEQFGVNAEQGVSNLLIAFYFRNTGIRESGSAFEFTHKSFEEYLSAKSIVSRLFEIKDSCMKNNWKRFRSTIDDMALLWIEYYAKSPITYEIFSFLCNELERYNHDEVHILQEIICELLSYIFKFGLPFEKMPSMERPSHFNEQKQDRNAEEILLASYSACARITKSTLKMEWPSRTFIKEWIMKMNYNNYKEQNIVNQMLNHLDLSYAELNNIILSKASINESNLTSANLCRATLDKAVMNSTILREADMSNANMSGIELKNADMSNANLTNAYLHEANLAEADLSSATLTNADLYNANLERTVLCGCDLRFTSLIYADLTCANLLEANLFGADLRSAVLTNAKVRKEQMENVIMNEATKKTLTYDDSLLDAEIRG